MELEAKFQSKRIKGKKLGNLIKNLPVLIPFKFTDYIETN